MRYLNKCEILANLKRELETWKIINYNAQDKMSLSSIDISDSDVTPRDIIQVDHEASMNNDMLLK